MTLHTCTRSLVIFAYLSRQSDSRNNPSTESKCISKVQTKTVGNNIRCGKFFGMI